MTNYYYELVEEYPNSPRLGTIITPNMNEYYLYQPNVWTKFWKKEKFGDVILKTQDGVEIRVGDKYYYITETGVIHENVAHVNMNKEKIYYSNLELAQKARIEKINLKIENETIISEDVVLYGVCIKGNWQICETNSIKLFYPARPLTNSWKYFRTIKEREDYIFKYKPKFSFNDLLNLRIKLQNLTDLEAETYIKINL